MKQEKEQLNEKLNLQKEKNEQERQHYEQKIIELKEIFEKRATEHEKWSRKFESENEKLKDVIEIIKKDENLGTFSKKNKMKTEIGPEINKDLMLLMNQMKEMMKEIKESKSESNESKLLFEKEKELREVEKKFLRQINDAKILSETTLETVKKSFYNEIQMLKVK